MKTKNLPLSQIYEYRNNPRIISDANFQKLIDSILVFPKMLSLRPVVIDADHNSLGGNMRLRSLNSIAQMTIEAISERLNGIKDYQQKSEQDKKAIVRYWNEWKKKPSVEVVDAADLSEDECKQFMIKDNVSVGEWDWALLESWDQDQLQDWGVSADMPDFGNFEENDNLPNKKKTETERLSEVKFVDCYYTPIEKPDIKLEDCIDLDLFNKKVDIINKSNLSKGLKDTMKMLAYRFIKIDFESIANYYAFNANDEEKRIIERLRCVLVDGAIDGFFEDRMLRVNDYFNEPTND